MQKDKEKSKGNIIEDRQRMKAEESQEGTQKIKKEKQKEKLDDKQRTSEEKDRRQQERK